MAQGSSNPKDAYWFSHDAGASHDPKMLELRQKWGIAGYGAFFFIVERLREASPTYKIELRGIPAIAYDGQFETGIFQECFDIGLLQSDGDFFWSDTLIERMERYDNIKKKRAEAGSKGGYAKAKRKQRPGKCLTNAKQKPSKTEANSTEDRIGEDRKEKDQTPRGKISSLKDNIENVPDVEQNNNNEVENGQVEESNNKKKMSQIIITVMRELWPALDQIGAEDCYMKIRTVHNELSAEKLEKILRFAWAKWPINRTIWESGGLGAWIINEIGYFLRDEKREADYEQRKAEREAERSGAGPKKADIRVSLDKITKNLEKARSREAASILHMDRIQAVVNEAVEDGIELPEILISWLNMGQVKGAFELGDNHKLLSWHLASGTPNELIAEPPKPMSEEELQAHLEKTKRDLGWNTPPEAPESPEAAAKDDAAEDPGALDADDLAILKAASERSRTRPATSAGSASLIGDLIGGAVGAKKKG